MTEARFWALVEDSLQKSEGAFDAQEEAFRQSLLALPVAEVESAARILSNLKNSAYRFDLWAAAYLAGGGCSDDSFMDFRSWLISRGRSAYESVTDNPDNLADLDPGEDYFFEGFQYVPAAVYRELSKQELKDLPEQPDDPENDDWDFNFDDEKEMSRRLPRIWDKVREERD